MEIIFNFSKYWGLRHNWDMSNPFMFDGRYGVQVKKVETNTYLETLDIGACGDSFPR